MKNFESSLHKIIAEIFQDPQNMIEKGVAEYSGKKIKETVFGMIWYEFPSQSSISGFITWLNNQPELADYVKNFVRDPNPDSKFTVIFRPKKVTWS